jgi:hypothetical protein
MLATEPFILVLLIIPAVTASAPFTAASRTAERLKSQCGT